MPIRLREYHQVDQWRDAVELLRRADVKTVPLVIAPRPQSILDRPVDAVVDLRSDLNFITFDDTESTRIGAWTPLQALAESEGLRAQAGGLLPEAARLTAHYGLRHIASVAGLLLSPEGPPEILLALLVLDAVVVLEGDARREAPLAEFLSPGISMGPGELPTEVRYRTPSALGSGTALERVGRTPRDEAIVAAAALVEMKDGVVQRARLALAGTGPRPSRAASAEKLLVGQPPTPELLQSAAEAVTTAADPISDFRASAEYRRAMAGVLARRALEAAGERAK